MNSHAITKRGAASRVAVGRLGCYLELTKPKIALLELVTVAAAAALAGWSLPLVWHAVLGTALVAASASAWNQWAERNSDAAMARTADRPLPAGRLTPAEAAWFGGTTGVLGGLHLALCVNLTTAGLALLSWTIYVVIYTPLKRRTTVNTYVGALAGAIPILIGWSAMGRPLGLEACSLAMIVFLWQFPHFMAIAWLYRDDYARAGMQMLPVVDPSGLRAAGLAVVAALLLLPVSLVPALLPLASNVYIYAAWALVLGGGQLLFAAMFLLDRSEQRARRLLGSSLVYLPGLLSAMLL